MPLRTASNVNVESPFDVCLRAKDRLAESLVIEGCLVKAVKHDFFRLPLNLCQLA